MKHWFVIVSVAAFAVTAACGSDDLEPSDSSAGQSGGGGDSGDAGSSTGGTGEGGEGGSAPAPMCDPPTPPLVAEGGGGAGGAQGGAGGASAGAGGAAEGGATGTPSVSAPLAIAGSYVDDFDGAHEITSAKWESSGAVYNISAFDNEAMYVIARNDQSNEYSPCLWSRFDWVESDGDLYYCTTVFDGETEQDALDAERPDDSDPANEGCGMFAWTKLTPQ